MIQYKIISKSLDGGNVRMNLKYSLTQPLIGTTRKYTASAKRCLLLETNGKCAKCKTAYNQFDDATSINDERSNLEIAHIYGLRNFQNIPHENKKFHVQYTEDLNSYENLILLCKKCHQDYDRNPNYECYKKMVLLKSTISSTHTTNSYIYTQLSFYLDDIVQLCHTIQDKKNFTYDTSAFLEKMKKNKIDTPNINHYSTYLTTYAISIDTFFRDYQNDLGIRLIECFSIVYKKLKDNESDKNRILDFLSEAEFLKNLSNHCNRKLFDALVAYMIWKCEVLDK